MRTSDITGRRNTYGGYEQPLKVNSDQPKQDGIRTWKVPGIKIDVS